MVQLLDRYHHLLRWIAEFSLLPLHILATYAHLYGTASLIGSTLMVAYAASAIRQARVHGF